MEMVMQMPNNYVEVCDDEMMYVEGEVCFGRSAKHSIAKREFIN